MTFEKFHFMQILNIATVCFVNESQELLVVRKKNTSFWMLPGGKLDHQETPAEGVIREVWEELQITLEAQNLAQLGTFDALAANEADTSVHAHAFLAKLPGKQKPRISAEIAEMRWLPLNRPFPISIAPLLRNHIIPALQGL
ncbi:NUDIX domain-containing protein [Paenalcaligenes niemegkensis]|uniref:NUDIX hydrolase n=1 Tax=Paenalcaligenes niemegkensis TaxID=2895469 RepID=UPI001EE8D2AF|nr:NUDIX domain-containing protein [Paenalcaligenes niemegkensis]MCQ9616975.1 NUDIX domain-containing protein [Paenalcaligenes niemegkensis]